MNKTTLTQNEELRNRAKVLLEEFVFQFARLSVNTGTKNPVFSPYRYQLGIKLKFGSDRTITRILDELTAAKWITRLPQRKDFKRKRFGPLRIAPARKIWARIKRMIRTLKAEDARRQKRKIGRSASFFSSSPHKKTRRPLLASISYSLQSREGKRVREEEKKEAEGTIFQKLKPDMSLTQMVEAVQKAKQAEKV